MKKIVFLIIITIGLIGCIPEDCEILTNNPICNGLPTVEVMTTVPQPDIPSNDIPQSTEETDTDFPSFPVDIFTPIPVPTSIFISPITATATSEWK